MIMISHEDITAIHRAHSAGGIDAALAEGRRRWAFSDKPLLDFIERILAMSVEPPEAMVRKGDRREFPDPQGRPKRTR